MTKVKSKKIGSTKNQKSGSQRSKPAPLLAKPKTLMGTLKRGAKKITEQVATIFSSVPKDIVEAIEEDHKSLRKYLAALKDTDREMSERRAAYEDFSSLLKSHSSSEQTAVYEQAMKLTGHEMHIKVAEGYVEHKVANDLMNEMKKTKNALSWSAHANVLSESVEHHLKEEERDLLPRIRETASPKLNQEMLAQFLKLRAISWYQSTSRPKR